MTLGYLMNTYPMTSTTFIGREIAAIEAAGTPIRRYAIRPWAETLVDAGDQREKLATQYLLTGSRAALIWSVLAEPLRAPAGFARAVGLTLRLLRNARGGTVRHLAYLAEALRLLRLTRRDGITHLHVHFSTNAATVAMLANAMGGPTYSFTVHGPDELLCPSENSIGLKASRARFVACISHFARSQMMLFSHQRDWNRLEIVHCGVDPARYGAEPHGPYGRRLLFVGRLTAVKGVPLLLSAVAALRDRFPDLRLTVVGDGPDRAALEAAATKLGIGGEVRFLGYQTQDAVTGLLHQHDALVLPSFAEGVPVVLMEAMAAYLPVVASQVAGVPELVENGVSGYLVPAGDLASLTARLGDLLADPERCRTMGEAGRARVEAEFTIAAAASRLKALFDHRAENRP